MPSRRRRASLQTLLALTIALSGCADAGTPAPSALPAASPDGAASQRVSTSASPGGASGAASGAPVAAVPDGPFACGAHTCRSFASPQKALAWVLEQDKPRVLAFGESHAQKGAEKVRSTTSHFTEELLPMLEGKASALVLELWVADGKCGKEKEKKVAEAQKPVTSGQAESNQNEFVKLGEKSKSLGIVPFILRPTCEEYDRIQAAGDNAVLEMLAMITRNMKTKAEKLFADAEKKKPGATMVLTYGGAMHNDRAPKPGRDEWSFAADLDKLAPGRYVELDLVVPEFIKATESWKGLPWYDAYDAARFADKTVLIEFGQHSYALVFARGVTGP